MAEREQQAAAGVGEPAEDPKHSAQRQRARPWVKGIIFIAVILLVGGALIYWLATRNEISTDDAFVDGRAASVAPRVAGPVSSLDVTDNQFVHSGDPLVHLDPRPFKLALDEAQAELDTARQQLAAQQHGRRTEWAVLGRSPLQRRRPSASRSLGREPGDCDDSFRPHRPSRPSNRR